MDVHTRDLRYFLLVAEELNFTRAAARAFISQPAMSKQIRLLEREIGGSLFERDGRTVRLTELGQSLQPIAREQVAGWVDAARRLRAVAQQSAQRLTVGMNTGPGRDGMLGDIRRRLVGEVVLQLRQFDWGDPSAGLSTGDSDVAFIWLPLSPSAQYRWLILAHEQRRIAMVADHPLARRRRLSVTDIVDEPLLALPASAGPLRDHWLLTDDRPADSPPLIGGEVAGADEAYEALIDGRGLVVLAERNVPLLARDGVVTRPLAGVAPAEFALAWRRSDRRPLVAGYIAAARAMLQSRESRPT